MGNGMCRSTDRQNVNFHRHRRDQLRFLRTMYIDNALQYARHGTRSTLKHAKRDRRNVHQNCADALG